MGFLCSMIGCGIVTNRLVVSFLKLVADMGLGKVRSSVRMWIGFGLVTCSILLPSFPRVCVFRRYKPLRC
jgi:hypothetical protein